VQETKKGGSSKKKTERCPGKKVLGNGVRGRLKGRDQMEIGKEGRRREKFVREAVFRAEVIQVKTRGAVDG